MQVCIDASYHKFKMEVETSTKLNILVWKRGTKEREKPASLDARQSGERAFLWKAMAGH